MSGEVKERILKLLDELKPYVPSVPFVGNIIDKVKNVVSKMPDEKLKHILKEVKSILEEV